MKVIIIITLLTQLSFIFQRLVPKRISSKVDGVSDDPKEFLKKNERFLKSLENSKSISVHAYKEGASVIKKLIDAVFYSESAIERKTSEILNKITNKINKENEMEKNTKTEIQDSSKIKEFGNEVNEQEPFIKDDKTEKKISNNSNSLKDNNKKPKQDVATNMNHPANKIKPNEINSIEHGRYYDEKNKKRNTYSDNIKLITDKNINKQITKKAKKSFKVQNKKIHNEKKINHQTVNNKHLEMINYPTISNKHQKINNKHQQVNNKHLEKVWKTVVNKKNQIVNNKQIEKIKHQIINHKQIKNKDKSLIEAMPTFLFFKGGKQVDKVVGANIDSIISKVQSLQ